MWSEITRKPSGTLVDDLCGSGVIDSPISPSVSGGVPRGHTPEVLQRATEFSRHVAMLGRVGGIP